MAHRIAKRLISMTLAAVLCLMLPSCAAITRIKDVLGSIPDKPSDFDRYVEYLNGLNQDHEDEYDGYGYNAYVYPVRVQDEVCVNLAGVTNALGGDDGLTYSIILVLIIPEGGHETHYGFTFSRYSEDGTHTEIVRASGTLNNAEYDGQLPAFEEYENFESHDDSAKDSMQVMATEEMERLLAAAGILLARADLTPAALGFTYTPEERDTIQTASIH